MELWIRSQDRERLIKCNSVMLNISDTRCILANFNGKDDYTYSVYDHIGKYKTKERALEVLDEIQKILKPQLIIKNSGKIIGAFEDTIIREGATYETKELATYVYEMPKE